MNISDLCENEFECGWWMCVERWKMKTVLGQKDQVPQERRRDSEHRWNKKKMRDCLREK